MAKRCIFMTDSMTQFRLTVDQNPERLVQSKNRSGCDSIQALESTLSVRADLRCTREHAPDALKSRRNRPKEHCAFWLIERVGQRSGPTDSYSEATKQIEGMSSAGE